MANSESFNENMFVSRPTSAISSIFLGSDIVALLLYFYLVYVGLSEQISILSLLIMSIVCIAIIIFIFYLFLKYHNTYIEIDRTKDYFLMGQPWGPPRSIKYTEIVDATKLQNDPMKASPLHTGFDFWIGSKKVSIDAGWTNYSYLVKTFQEKRGLPQVDRSYFKN